MGKLTRPFEAREVLLNLGADIDDLDSDGDGQAQTALRTAIYRADSTVVRYLLMKGADPQKTDGKGRNPFHMLALDYCTRIAYSRYPRVFNDGFTMDR